MLKDTLGAIEVDADRKVQAAASNATQAKENLDDLDKMYEDSQAAAEASKADVKEREAALSASVAELQPCRSELEAKQAELQCKDADTGAAAMGSAQLHAVCEKMHSSSQESTLATLRGLSFPPEKLENIVELENELRQHIATLSQTMLKEGMARLTF